jgi:tRNA (adenine22-N1)-methyltransferase
LFPACKLGADIGTDHGRLPLHLLETGRCERMLVSDVSWPALQKAQELITRHHLDHRTVFLQADGLDALQEPVQALSLLGMGGDTMCAILKASPQRLGNARLILSPHTEIQKVRGLLPGIGYKITRETIARSGGRFYVILQAEPGTAVYTEKEELLGPFLLREHPPLFQEYLLWRKSVTGKALKALKDAGDEERLPQWLRAETYIREELP